MEISAGAMMDGEADRKHLANNDISADMWDKPILIHVGLHKCASTWLQKVLFPDLNLGFFSPLGGMASMAVTEFVVVDPLAFDKDHTRRRLLSEAGQMHREGLLTVISHEALSSRPHHGQYYAPTVANRLHEVFPNARILLIFREQVSMISALHVEHVRNGGTHSLSEFIGTGNEPPGWAPLCKLSFFQYDHLVHYYRNKFGSSNVLAIPLELLRDDPDEFHNWIFDFAGAPRRTVPPQARMNTTWAPTSTEACRLLNRLVRRNPLGPQQPMSYRIAQRFVRFVDRLTPRSAASRLEQRRRNLIKERVGNEFHESNLQLAKITGLPLAHYGYGL